MLINIAVTFAAVAILGGALFFAVSGLKSAIQEMRELSKDNRLIAQ
jgi:hypothetical protein